MKVKKLLKALQKKDVSDYKIVLHYHNDYDSTLCVHLYIENLHINHKEKTVELWYK